MEGQVASRRLNMIAGHFVGHDDVSATPTHIFPLCCSSSLNSVIRRYDSKMYFARQGSDSQACFMRQISNEQGTYVQPIKFTGSATDFSSRLYFARQGSDSQACYMRPVSTEQGNFAQPTKCTGSENDCSPKSFEIPLFSRPSQMVPNFQDVGALFSRPSQMVPNFQDVGVVQHVVQDCTLPVPAPEHPQFSRPSKITTGQEQFHPKDKVHAFELDGLEWSPRMDVAESGCSYAITLELPGVGIKDIRVEVTDKNLVVVGKRSTQWWKVENCSNDSASLYHKREIFQGPYQVMWPLPSNGNKDCVSAEFVNGILRITIPKL